MSHVLTYNGITLDYILTESYRQEPERSEDGVDVLWTKITIQVQCLFNKTVQPAIPGEDPTDTMNRVRVQLLTPRQTLTYNTFNGKTLLTSPEPGDQTDAHNGPVPLHCNIVSLTEGTWLIDYAVETRVVECYSGTQDVPFLSNRWKTSVEIDQSGYAKRTIDGQMRFRTNVADNPDNYRSVFMPGLLTGFVRESINVQLHSDNSGINYTVVDRQAYVNPPPPATKIEAQYGSSNSTFGFGVFEEFCNVRVWGDKCTHKSDLINVAISVAFSRIFAPGVRAAISDARADNLRKGDKKNGGVKMIKKASIMDHLHENYVEVRVETLGSPLKQTVYGIAPFEPAHRAGALDQLDYLLDNKGKSTDYGTQQYDPGAYGSVGLHVAKVLFGDACHDNVPKADQDTLKGCRNTKLPKNLLPIPPK